MSTDRVADLQRAMQLIADAVDELPAECRDLAGNALLNITAEAVARMRLQNRFKTGLDIAHGTLRPLLVA